MLYLFSRHYPPTTATDFSPVFIFGGALFGFTLARLQFLAFDDVFCLAGSIKGAAPGECYWYRQKFYHTGIMLHLAAVLPAGFLVVFQFVPVIRHKFLLYHRIAGHLIILLVLIGNAGALMIARHAFGGHVSTHLVVGVLAIISTLGILNAYYNIKRLQLDQHRAWMLRVFAWMGAIVTARIIIALVPRVISAMPAGYELYDQRSCKEMASIFPDPKPLYQLHPQCMSDLNTTTDERIIIKADFVHGNPLEMVAALGVSFPIAVWLSLVLHAFGVELYLALTPKETQRLRQVSYERQLERGYKNPGSAGLVPEKLGDFDPWVPKTDSNGSEDGSLAQSTPCINDKDGYPTHVNAK